MKANHNTNIKIAFVGIVVSNDSKILKWKQITTKSETVLKSESCFQWFKDTKMKANHNNWNDGIWHVFVVSNDSKILKWKQITTSFSYFIVRFSCFQWFKDTKMKANHNILSFIVSLNSVVSNDSKILKWKQITTQIIRTNKFWMLFPMIQRY